MLFDISRQISFYTILTGYGKWGLVLKRRFDNFAGTGTDPAWVKQKKK
jgi:hypothetical protein